MANRSPRHIKAGGWNLKGKKSRHCACCCCSILNLRDVAENERVRNEEIRSATIGDGYPEVSIELETDVDLRLADRRERDEVDRGRWEIFHGSNGNIGIISSDFKHDVVLYVNGDFASDKSKMEYAQLLAERLNRTIPQ